MDITLLVVTRRHLGCLDTTSGDLRAARRVLASLLAAAGFGALTFVHPSSGQAWTADATSTQEMVR